MNIELKSSEPITIHSRNIQGQITQSSEIQYAFNYPIQISPEIEQILPPGPILLDKLMAIQESEKENLLLILPDLYACTSNDRLQIERNLLGKLVSLANDGVITPNEINKLFECCRLQWEQYLSESEFNRKILEVFRPHPSTLPPHEKHITLENAYELAKQSRDKGSRVVTVFGTFDFHDGHSDLFNAARELAGDGIVITFITSDAEAKHTRPNEGTIMGHNERCEVVASHTGVNFYVELPWEGEFRDPTLFDINMKEIHVKLMSDFRLVGGLDDRANLFEDQCRLGMTKLVYRFSERGTNPSSTVYRKKLQNPEV